MRLLLLSNSTNPGEEFLAYSKLQVKDFLGNKSVKVVFIPYAAVTFSYDEYEFKVRGRFVEMGHELVSIHRVKSPVDAITFAEAIVIGGGNTFHLLKQLQENNLIQIIRERIFEGVPYIGWSAGSNVACPTICTTNDMPIAEPLSFQALNIIPFQINPHYTDFVHPGHGGETRDQRIAEYIMVNSGKTVVGLREGTMLKYENNVLKLIGNKKAKIFNLNQEPYEIGADDDFTFLMEKKSR